MKTGVALMSNTYIVIIEPSVVLAVLQVLQDNKGTATKEEINMIMDIAEKNKDGSDTFKGDGHLRFC